MEEPNNLQYKFIRELGHGSFGMVYLGQDRSTGLNVAIKKLKWSKSMLAKKMPSFIREIEMMRGLRHPNVVQFIEQFEVEDRVYIVLEYCSLGELSQYVESGTLSPEEVVSVFRQILSGLEYVHEQGYMHRDLKPENVFIAEGFVAKIGDCGLGKKYQEGVRHTRNVGTPMYTPPNILLGDDQYTQKCDVFSLGLILYYLVFGEHLFCEATNLIKLIRLQEELKQDRIDSFLERLKCNDSFKSIFKNSLANQEQNRMTSSQLKQLFNKEFPPSYRSRIVARDDVDDLYRYVLEARNRFRDIQKYLQLAQLLLNSKATVFGRPQCCIIAVITLNVYLLALRQIVIQCEKPFVTVDGQTIHWSRTHGVEQVRDRFIGELRREYEGIEELRARLIRMVFTAAARQSTSVPMDILKLLEQPYEVVLDGHWRKYRATLVQYLKAQWKEGHIAMTPQEQTICNCVKSVLL